MRVDRQLLRRRIQPPRAVKDRPPPLLRRLCQSDGGRVDEKGYSVFLVTDEVASNRNWKHKWAPSHLHQRGATLIDSESLLLQP